MWRWGSLRFGVRIKTVGLATVGWSTPSALGVDIPVAKKLVRRMGEVEYRVYVPGSSFKGALRSAASRIAEAYSFTSCGFIDPEMINEAHRLRGVCHVCRLFGYPSGGAGGLASVSDLELQDDVERSLPIRLTRTKLEDVSLKVEEGALYTTEHIPPDMEFKGFIEINFEKDEAMDVAETDMLGLLLLSLAELRLGRFGRRSLIDIRIEDSEEIEKRLNGTRWGSLLDDLRRWIWTGTT